MVLFKTEMHRSRQVDHRRIWLVQTVNALKKNPATYHNNDIVGDQISQMQPQLFGSKIKQIYQTYNKNRWMLIAKLLAQAQ